MPQEIKPFIVSCLAEAIGVFSPQDDIPTTNEQVTAEYAILKMAQVYHAMKPETQLEALEDIEDKISSIEALLADAKTQINNFRSRAIDSQGNLN